MRLCLWTIAIAACLSGCKSPEDGRPRAGGAGGDGGNYPSKPIGLSSKVDGSKPIAGPVQ